MKMPASNMGPRDEDTAIVQPAQPPASRSPCNVNDLAAKGRSDARPRSHGMDSTHPLPDTNGIKNLLHWASFLRY